MSIHYLEYPAASLPHQGGPRHGRAHQADGHLSECDIGRILH
jgi:hypothetical protein